MLAHIQAKRTHKQYLTQGSANLSAAECQSNAVKLLSVPISVHHIFSFQPVSFTFVNGHIYYVICTTSTWCKNRMSINLKYLTITQVKYKTRYQHFNISNNL